MAASVTPQVCVNIQHPIDLDIGDIALNFTVGCHIPHDLVYPLDGILVCILIFGLPEKMVINFFIDIFRVFASSDKVVAFGKFKDVDMRHSCFL
jgi:hypothetical protein